MELLKLTPSEKLISSTEEEVISMEHIIDTLLLLANPSKHLQEHEKIELIGYTEKILENYSEHDITFDHPKKKIYLECAPEFYKRVFSNLLENALKYKSEGPVWVKLDNNKLVIENKVHRNLSETEIQKLTEVFYQSDTSRSSSGQ
jgi:signal transduction histidine kinase